MQSRRIRGRPSTHGVHEAPPKGAQRKTGGGNKSYQYVSQSGSYVGEGGAFALPPGTNIGISRSHHPSVKSYNIPTAAQLRAAGGAVRGKIVKKECNYLAYVNPQTGRSCRVHRERATGRDYFVSNKIKHFI